jgi:hypothetical protein
MDRYAVKYHPKFPPLYHLKFPPPGYSGLVGGSVRESIPLTLRVKSQ